MKEAGIKRKEDMCHASVVDYHIRNKQKNIRNNKEREWVRGIGNRQKFNSL